MLYSHRHCGAGATKRVKNSTARGAEAADEELREPFWKRGLVILGIGPAHTAAAHKSADNVAWVAHVRIDVNGLFAAAVLVAVGAQPRSILLWRLAHRRVVSPRQTPVLGAADNGLPIVPQPVRATGSRDTVTLIDDDLSHLDAATMQVSVEQKWRGTVGEVVRAALDNPGHESFANSKTEL